MDFENDGDYLTNRLEELGERSSRLRKRGICDHGWLNSKPDKTICLHCGEEFDSFEEAMQSHAEVLGL